MCIRAIIITVLVCLSGWLLAQTLVSTQPQNTRPVLEEFGGMYCVYCPQGHQVISTLEAQYGDELVLLNYHNSSYASPLNNDPDLRNDFGEPLINQSGASGFPFATVNRLVFPGLEQESPGTTALGRNNWAAAVDNVRQTPSPVNVAARATLDIQTRQLELLIEYYYTANSAYPSNRLTVALLQNNVLAPQHGGGAGAYYQHQHLVRDWLTGQQGHTISSTTGQSFGSLTYVLQLPEHYRSIPLDLVNVELAIFISEGDQKILNGTKVVPVLTTSALSDANAIALIGPANVCGELINMDLLLRNEGQQDLQNLTIRYGIEGESEYSHTWHGSLAPMASTTLTLPATPLGVNGLQQSFYAVLESPNGLDDPTIYNNELHHRFRRSPMSEESDFSFTVRTDGYGYETYWEILSDTEEVLAYGGNPVVGNTDGGQQIAQVGDAGAYPNFSLITTPFSLPGEGCYQVRVLDDYGDGMCCSYGNGFFQLRDAGGNILWSGGSFGAQINTLFSVGGAVVATDEPTSNAQRTSSVLLYPNPLPKHQPLSIQWPNGPPSRYDWWLFSVDGRCVQTGNQDELPVSASLSAGHYLLHIRTAQARYALPLVVS